MGQSVNHPNDRMTYYLVAKRSAPLKELVGFLETYERTKK
jgi:hypothetical protein